MYARVATFRGDPGDLDASIESVRSQVESGDVPPGLEGAKLLMLVDRSTGDTLGITLFDSEEAMRRGDETLNGMSPATGSRDSVRFFEVPIQMIS